MHVDRILDPDHLPTAPFGAETVLFRHRLHETGLFEDDHLVRMIESHPRELIAVSSMGTEVGTDEWGDGDWDGVDAATLLDCVRRGHMWLSLRRFTDHQPGLSRLLNRAYDELEAHDPTFRTTRRDGGLLISSPTAFVHYHIDVPPNVLWHVRGRKRVWAYPVDDHELLAPDVRDAVVARERVEDVPYEPWFDDRAAVFDLDPGDVVTWPQNSPHRVENLEELNVSISSEHFTPESLRAVRVRRANRWLRHRLGLRATATTTSGPGYLFKTTLWAAGYLVEKCLGATKPEFEYPTTFRVDPDAPRCIAPINDNSAEPGIDPAAEPATDPNSRPSAEPVLAGR